MHKNEKNKKINPILLYFFFLEILFHSKIEIKKPIVINVKI